MIHPGNPQHPPPWPRGRQNCHCVSRSFANLASLTIKGPYASNKETPQATLKSEWRKLLWPAELLIIPVPCTGDSHPEAWARLQRRWAESAAPEGLQGAALRVYNTLLPHRPPCKTEAALGAERAGIPLCSE